jgi:hypothetical protein
MFVLPFFHKLTTEDTEVTERSFLLPTLCDLCALGGKSSRFLNLPSALTLELRDLGRRNQFQQALDHVFGGHAFGLGLKVRADAMP